MNVKFHLIGAAIMAAFLSACSNSGPAAATDSELGNQSSAILGTSQGGSSSVSLGGRSSSSGGTSGKTGCLMNIPDFNLKFCGVGVSSKDCANSAEEGVTATYGACPSNPVATCQTEYNNQMITVYDYSPDGSYCEALTNP